MAPDTPSLPPQRRRARATPNGGAPVPPERPPTSPERRPGARSRPETVTRASAAWFGTSVALVLMALLVVLILQNPDDVDVHYLGLTGSLPLGTALLIAAVAGAAVVSVIGVVRLTQLRVRARRARRVGRAGGGADREPRP